MANRNRQIVFLFMPALLVQLLTSCGGAAPDGATTQNGPSNPGTGSTTLSWDAPTANTDNTALNNLAGYIIYFGPSSGAMTSSINVTDPNRTTYVVGNLTVNTSYRFAIAAINLNGVESDLSNAIERTITR